jgi:hypothetical protein
MIAESANQTFQFDAHPIGHAGSDRNIVLARIPVQQQLKSSHERHEHARPVLLAPELERADEPVFDEQLLAACAARWSCRAPVIGSEVMKAWLSVELFLPKRNVRTEFLLAEPSLHPAYEVAVLERHLRQLRPPTFHCGSVNRRELGRKNCVRPVVVYQMMRHDDQVVRLRPRLDQSASEGTIAAQIKGQTGMLGRNLPGLSFSAPLVALVRFDDLERQGALGQNDLREHLPAQAENGTKAGVPAHQLI